GAADSSRRPRAKAPPPPRAPLPLRPDEPKARSPDREAGAASDLLPEPPCPPEGRATGRPCRRSRNEDLVVGRDVRRRGEVGADVGDELLEGEEGPARGRLLHLLGEVSVEVDGLHHRPEGRPRPLQVDDAIAARLLVVEVVVEDARDVA